jgi:hypothetical protein
MQDGEVTGGWSKLYNQGLHNLYTSLNIIQTIISRTVRMLGNVACVGEKRMCRSFVEKRGGGSPFGRPRCSWEDNIKIGLKEIGWEGVNVIHLALSRDH